MKNGKTDAESNFEKQMEPSLFFINTQKRQIILVEVRYDRWVILQLTSSDDETWKKKKNNFLLHVAEDDEKSLQKERAAETGFEKTLTDKCKYLYSSETHLAKLGGPQKATPLLSSMQRRLADPEERRRQTLHGESIKLGKRNLPKQI